MLLLWITLLIFVFLVLHRRNSKLLVSLRARTTTSSEVQTPLQSVQSRGPPQKLRVLCQNMWCTNSLFAERKGSKGPRPTDRFDAVVAEASQYDILILQELFVMRLGFHLIGQDVAHLERQLVNRGFVYHTDIVYNLPLLLGQSAGVAVFSRWPIVDCQHVTFNQRSFKDSLNEKGFVRAAVQVPSGEIVQVFSTHMDSFRVKKAAPMSAARKDPVGYRENVRLDQIDQLGGAVRGVSNERVIVAGDFNIRLKSPVFGQEYDFMVEKLEPLRDLFPQQNCDHVLVSSEKEASGRLRVEKADVLNIRTPDGLPVSDHSGLRIILETRA